MNILAPVRRDRVLEELPQVGTRDTSSLWLEVSVGGEKVAPEQLDWAQPCHPARPARCSWVVRFPPHPPPRAARLRDKSSILKMSLSVPEEGGRFARAQRLPHPRHLRLPGAPDRHRGVS